MQEWNVAQRERATVQKNTKLETRANAFISSASQLSGAISKLSGVDSVSSSDSSGEALGWSPLKQHIALGSMSKGGARGRTWGGPR